MIENQHYLSVSVGRVSVWEVKALDSSYIAIARASQPGNPYAVSSAKLQN